MLLLKWIERCERICVQIKCYHLAVQVNLTVIEIALYYNLYHFYFDYTSLHIFTQPDQAKAVVKLIKHLLSTFFSPTPFAYSL